MEVGQGANPVLSCRRLKLKLNAFLGQWNVVIVRQLRQVRHLWCIELGRLVLRRCLRRRRWSRSALGLALAGSRLSLLWGWAQVLTASRIRGRAWRWPRGLIRHGNGRRGSRASGLGGSDWGGGRRKSRTTTTMTTTTTAPMTRTKVTRTNLATLFRSMFSKSSPTPFSSRYLLASGGIAKLRRVLTGPRWLSDYELVVT